MNICCHAGQATAGSAPVQLGVGSGTASVDGVIASGEYAVAVSGMNNSMNAPVQYSHRQSRCFLSWDAENLYAAMESPGQKTGSSAHTKNVMQTSGKMTLWSFSFLNSTAEKMPGSSYSTAEKDFTTPKTARRTGRAAESVLLRA